MTISINGSTGITFPNGSILSPANTNAYLPDISMSGGAVSLKSNIPELNFDGTYGLRDSLGSLTGLFTATIPTNQQELNLANWASTNGWNGVDLATITISPGVYIWSNTDNIPAMTTGNFPTGLTIINQGYIMGTSGNVFSSGAATAAISLGSNVTIDNTYGNAYIGGGGGYGGGYAGSLFTPGGEGAGGKSAPLGGAGTYGGAGGRAFPGVGGAGTSSSAKLGISYGGAGTAGGGGSACGGGNGETGTSGAGGSANNPGANGSGINNFGSGGGGGGGWGASGGSGSGVAGGAGGNSVQLNGYSVSFVSGDTTRVWGAIS